MVPFKRVWILDAIVKDFFSYVKFNNNLIAYVVFFFESCVVASECIVTLDVDFGDCGCPEVEMRVESAWGDSYN